MTEESAPADEKQTGSSLGDMGIVGLALVGTFALFYLGYRLFAADPFEISSDCKGVTGGVSCAITHTSAEPQTIAVCAEIKRICSNGVASVAKGCFTGLVKPKASGTLLVADSEFSNAQACQNVTAQTDSLSIALAAAPAPAGTRP